MAANKRAGTRPAARRKQAGAGGGESKETLVLDTEAVRHWRLQRGYTQQALAQQRAVLDGQTLRISYAQLRRIEKDGRAGPGTARILAALLGVELAQLRPRQAGRGPCGLPREPSVDFVGRQAQVEAVLEILAREGSVRLAAAVEGLPGIGKTELALQVCAACERSAGYRIYWFDAQSADLRSAWADTVAPHLGIEHPDPAMRTKLALRAVEASGEPTLLVLDNLEQWSQSQPWPRPQGRHLRWLVTTRISRLGDRAFEHIELPVLDAASARELALRIAGAELAQRPGFEELLAHLDGYTIALELAAAFLSRFPEVTPLEYLGVLQEGKRDLLEEEVADRTPYQTTLDRALELLWRRLPPSLRDAWVLAARFAQDRAGPALSEACGLDRRVRAQLRDFHLIQSDAHGWSMHRLTRAFARRAGVAAVQLRARGQLIAGCAERAKAIRFPDGFRIYAPDRAHFDAALAAVEEGGLEAAAAASYFARIGVAHHCLGELSRARALLEAALQRDEDAPSDLVARATHQSDLALVLEDLGEPLRAESLLTEALAAKRRLLGEHHSEVASCLASLAWTVKSGGDLPRARALMEESLEVTRRALGDDDPEVVLATGNLAALLQDLGELPRARELLERVLETALRVCGEDHPDLLVFRGNLAGVLHDMGELAGAAELLERSLAASLRVLGESHPHVAAQRSKLSRVLLDAGNLPRARELLEQALASSRPMLGEDHPQLAVHRSNLARVLWAQGEQEPAKALWELALGATVQAFGPDHPHVASIRAQLARALLETGERARGTEQLAEALRGARLQPEGAQIREAVERTAREYGAGEGAGG